MTTMQKRAAHMLGVARYLMRLSKECGLSEEAAQEMYVLGFLHDIGYELASPEEHAEVGGEVLRRAGFEYWEAVKRHGVHQNTPTSMALKMLNVADMHVTAEGQEVSLAERLEDIATRYGEDSPAYRESCLIAEDVKSFQRSMGLPVG